MFAFINVTALCISDYCISSAYTSTMYVELLLQFQVLMSPGHFMLPPALEGSRSQVPLVHRSGEYYIREVIHPTSGLSPHYTTWSPFEPVGRNANPPGT